MGGYGSTRWASHEKAELVEDSLVLDAGKVGRDLLRTTHGPASATIRWTVRDREVGAVALWVLSRDEAGAHASLSYNAGGTPVEVPLRLVVTRPPLGGTRWWWCCPLAVDGRPCGRRVQKLYLPPSTRFFGCRSCHRLTYRSSQEHDKGVDAFLRDPAATRSALTASPEDLSSGTILKALKAARVSRERTEKMLRRLER